MCVYIYIYIHIASYVCLCMYVCTYIYIYIYTLYQALWRAHALLEQPPDQVETVVLSSISNGIKQQ